MYTDIPSLLWLGLRAAAKDRISIFRIPLSSLSLSVVHVVRVSVCLSALALLVLSHSLLGCSVSPLSTFPARLIADNKRI